MSTVVIRYDGVDITNDVVYKESFFTMNVNGLPGQFSLRVKDTRWTKFFRAGKEVTVDVDDVRVFGGYSQTAGEVYAFPVDNTRTRQAPRFWVITGSDYNLLLGKRVLYDRANPPNMNLRSWPKGSRIDEVIGYVFDNYTDLAADGVSRAGVTDFGSPNPDQDGVIGTASIPFGQACGIANALLNGVFYIDADKVFNFTDVDTATSPYTLTDHPAAAGEYGFREMTVTYDGSAMVNDQLSWGVGQSKSPVFARVQDAASINDHGRWQGGEMLSNIFRQPSIDKRADAIVNGNAQSKRGHKDDKKAWQVVTYQPLFKVGQKVAVRSDVFGISDVLPIRRMTIRFPSRRKPRFELVLSHELDQPWTIHEYLFPNFGWDFPRFDIPDIVDGWPPEEPEPELPGGYAGVTAEVTTLHLADRDVATSFEFNIFNHLTDVFHGEEHFHVKPEATVPYTLSDGRNLLSTSYAVDPPDFGFGAWPHSLILRGLKSYGRYLSFALPEGAFYAKIRWDRLSMTLNGMNYAMLDASAFPFPGRFQEVGFPQDLHNVSLPVVLRRGYWGTSTPTERPTAWGETVGTTVAVNNTVRYTPPPPPPSQGGVIWQDINYVPPHLRFEAAMPIAPGEQYLQFWLWWLEPRPFLSLAQLGTLTDQVQIINGVEYPEHGPVSVSGDTYTYHPSPGRELTVSPLMESDVDLTNVYGLSYEGTLPDGLEVEIYSRTQSVATAGRITTCTRAAQLSGDRTSWGVPAPYVPGSTNVYVSGVAQRLGADYTEASPELGQIEFMQAVPGTETVTVCFVPNGSF